MLERLLGKPREDVMDGLIAFLREPNLQVQGLDKATVLQALFYCRGSRRVSFGDAFIRAAAYADPGEVYSFDQRFPQEQVPVREP